MKKILLILAALFGIYLVGGGLVLWNGVNGLKQNVSDVNNNIVALGGGDLSNQLAGGITRVAIGAGVKWTTDLIPSSGFTVKLGSSALPVDHVFSTKASLSVGEFSNYASASTFVAGIGSSTVPSIKFSGALTSGFAADGASGVRILAAGNTQVEVFSSNVRVPAGSITTPGISATTDSNTGVFWNLAESVGFSTNGVQRFTISQTWASLSLPLVAQSTATVSGAFEVGGYASIGGNFLGRSTGSSSFAGSLAISKGLNANSFQGGGLTTCGDSSHGLAYSQGQFSCVSITGSAGGADTDIPFITVGNTASLAFERALTGTSNQITATDGGADGNFTLSIPTPFIVPGRASISGNFEINGTASLSSTLMGLGTGSNSFAGSLNLTKSLTTSKSVTAAGVVNTGVYTSSNTGSNSFSGSLNLSKSLTATNSVTAGSFVTAGLYTSSGTGSNSFAGSLNLTKSLTTSKSVTAAGVVNTAQYTSSGTGSNSFSGSLNISKSLTATNSITGGSFVTAGLYTSSGTGSNSFSGSLNISKSLTATNSVTAGSLVTGGSVTGGNASHTFQGSIVGTADNVLSLGSAVRFLKEIFAKIVRASVLLIAPNATGGATSGATSGSLAVDTASNSFNFGTGTERVIEPKKCFSVSLDGSDLTTQNIFAIWTTDEPYTFSDVFMKASGSNSLSWNLWTGGTAPDTKVFAADKKASGSAFIKYASFTSPAVGDGRTIYAQVSSTSAVLDDVLVRGCMRKDP